MKTLEQQFEDVNTAYSCSCGSVHFAVRRDAHIECVCGKITALHDLFTTELIPSDSEFEKKLCSLINSLSLENESDTADYILAQFLTSVFISFNNAIIRRDRHQGSK